MHVDVSEDVRGKNEAEQSGKSENRNAKFLPVGKAHKAMFVTYSSLVEEGTFSNSGFSTVAILNLLFIHGAPLQGTCRQLTKC